MIQSKPDYEELEQEIEELKEEISMLSHDYKELVGKYLNLQNYTEELERDLKK